MASVKLIAFSMLFVLAGTFASVVNIGQRGTGKLAGAAGMGGGWGGVLESANDVVKRAAENGLAGAADMDQGWTAELAGAADMGEGWGGVLESANDVVKRAAENGVAGAADMDQGWIAKLAGAADMGEGWGGVLESANDVVKRAAENGLAGAADMDQGWIAELAGAADMGEGWGGVLESANDVVKRAAENGLAGAADGWLYDIPGRTGMDQGAPHLRALANDFLLVKRAADYESVGVSGSGLSQLSSQESSGELGTNSLILAPMAIASIVSEFMTMVQNVLTLNELDKIPGQLQKMLENVQQLLDTISIGNLIKLFINNLDTIKMIPGIGGIVSAMQISIQTPITLMCGALSLLNSLIHSLSPSLSFSPLSICTIAI